MIVVRLKGGLGNQMFQFALGRTLAQMNDTELVLDKDFYLANDPKRKYGLGAFKIDERFACSRRTRSLPIIEEKSLRFDSEVLGAHEDCILDGYWQSEGYFRFIRGLIRQEFTPREPVRGAGEMRYCESAFLHVRRGDYVGNPVNRMLPLDYYRRGAERIAQKVPNVKFFVFSDDLAWCKEKLNLRHPVTFVDCPFPHEAIYLMGQCKHGVISASTFSWWGAWLTGREGIIVAPDRWFETKELDATDIVPDRWVRLSDESVEMETKRIDYPLNAESVVIDVGGYLGHWADEISAKYGCNIQVFEPVPEFAAKCRARFAGNPKITVNEAGISGSTRVERLTLDGDASRLRGGGTTIGVSLLDVAEVVSKCELVDLLKLNIEGEEYAVLQRLISAGLAERVKDIQVQFHKISQHYEDDRAAIRKQLSKTHELTFNFDWHWENWRKR